MEERREWGINVNEYVMSRIPIRPVCPEDFMEEDDNYVEDDYGVNGVVTQTYMDEALKGIPVMLGA